MCVLRRRIGKIRADIIYQSDYFSVYVILSLFDVRCEIGLDSSVSWEEFLVSEDEGGPGPVRRGG